MNVAGIYSAIVTRYKAGAFGIETFWPGKNYEPTAGEKHVRAYFMPSGNDPASLGATGSDRMTGIVQFDVMFPDGHGVGSALTKADDIAAYFQRGQSQAYGTEATVTFTGATILNPRNEDGWLRVPVSVGWYCHKARSVS